MTDFHSMTDQELNEWIALRRGWKRATNHRLENWRKFWYDPKDENQNDNGTICSCDIPDYCNDWKRAGELLEEMIERFGLIVLRIFSVEHFEEEAFIDADVLRCNWTKSDKLPRKIAEAYAVTNTVGDMTKEIGGEG